MATTAPPAAAAPPAKTKPPRKRDRLRAVTRREGGTVYGYPTETGMTIVELTPRGKWPAHAHAGGLLARKSARSCGPQYSTGRAARGRSRADFRSKTQEIAQNYLV